MQIRRTTNSLTQVEFSTYTADVIEREPKHWYFTIFDGFGQKYYCALDDGCKTFIDEKEALTKLRKYMLDRDLL